MDASIEGYREALEQALERVPVAERADAMEEMVDMLVKGGIEIWRSDLSKTSPWAFSESIAGQAAVGNLLISHSTYTFTEDVELAKQRAEDLANWLKKATPQGLANYLICLQPSDGHLD